MARLLKPLEEQLIAAEAELQKAEKKVVTCKERVSEIKKQIEDRDMRQAHTLLKQNGVTVEELVAILKKNTSYKK